MVFGRRALTRWARQAWPVLVFLVALAVYGRTQATTLTWQHDGADGGDLIAAAATLGVPHPSGYPLYTLLARLCLLVLPGEPAARVHWLSAVCAAAAAAFLGLSVAEGSAPLWSGREQDGAGRGGETPPSTPGGTSGSRVPTWLTQAVAASAALMLAFSPLLWGQATIAEVHALHMALLVAVFWLLLKWRSTGALWPARAAALLAGLALGNHLTSALLLPAIAVWLLAFGPRNALTGRRWLGLAAWFLCGLLVYLYLPLAAARQPAINWGDPRTWQQFWWLVTGRLYRGVAFGVPLGLLPGRLSAWASLLLEQFGWWGWVLALAGIWRLSQRDRWLLAFSLYAFAAHSVYALTYDRADSVVYLLPAVLMVGFWWGQGALTTVEAAWHWARARGSAGLVGTILAASLAAVILLPALQLGRNFAASNLSHDHDAADYIAAVHQAALPGALIITSGDRSTFALWYGRYALGERPDVAIVNANLWGYDWYRRTLTAHQPQVAQPEDSAPPADDLQALIRVNLRHRSVYVTDDARPVAAQYDLMPVGPLYRLEDGAQ